MAVNSIWAVAKNTIKQAIRMKIALVFIIMLLVLLPVLGVSTTGDETLKGRLQTFISYSLSLTSFLLCILTIAISIYTVTNDIKEKQIFTIVTKPVRRLEFLTGKLLGVVLLNVFLLFIFSVIIYSITMYMPKFYKATSSELEQVNNEFFTARAALVIPNDDFTQQAQEIYKQKETQDMLPENMTRSQAIKEINNILQVLSRSVDIGEYIEWEFENVNPLADSVFIRFKYETSEELYDSRIASRWIVGDPHLVRTREAGKTPVFERDFRHPIDTYQEIEIPAEYIPDTGKLLVRFINYPSNNIVVMFPKEGMEVLFKADNFTMNFIRSIILILSRIIFLACLGILTSTFLSFPVAILVCLVLFVTSSASGFVLESFNFLSQNVGVIYSYTLKWLIKLLPEFDKYNPTSFMIPGRLISWSLLGQCIFFMVCIKSLLLLGLSFVIFTYREIAKIIV